MPEVAQGPPGTGGVVIVVAVLAWHACSTLFHIQSEIKQLKILSSNLYRVSGPQPWCCVMEGGPVCFTPEIQHS